MKLTQLREKPQSINKIVNDKTYRLNK